MSEPVLIITQARMGSTRFPAKMVANLMGQPLLLWHLSRVSQVQTPHRLVVACPDTPDNYAIADLCDRHGYMCVLTPVPEADVLGRFAWIVQRYDATAYTEIVRCTADTPLVDPQVIDDLIAVHRTHVMPRPDLTGLAAEWPDGCDAELVAREALLTAHAEATLASAREHVTSFLWTQPARFRLATLACPFDLSQYAWSVDTPHDLDLVERILAKTLPAAGPNFTWRDIWHTLLRHPALAQQCLARGPRNRAYVEQVAREQGTTVQTWETLRYGAPGGGR